MQLNRLCALVAFLSLACALPTRAATPAVGKPAPPLAFAELLGAPDGTKTDWPSLHGKVVVLEFWATWCAPCIASIPHLNALAASLASSNVQFISIDDEDPALVKTFLAKKPIAGWVGLVDSKSNLFDVYGAKLRPTTVVIDTEGRVAASLNADLITSDQLLALASGKPVVFPVDPEAPQHEKILSDAKAAAGAATVRPLFELSIWPGNPDGQFSMTMHNRKEGNGYSYDLQDAPLTLLFQFMAGVPGTRLVNHEAASHAKYSMRISLPGTSLAELAPAIQLAIASAAGMKLTHLTTEEDAWVLQSSPTASQHGGMCFYNSSNDRLTMVKTSLDALAPVLEEALGAPVVNETAIPGDFDANLDLPKGDADAIRFALESNLGLTLIKARRSIDRIVLNPIPAPIPAPANAANQPGQPALIPGQQVQTIAVPRQ